MTIVEIDADYARFDYAAPGSRIGDEGDPLPEGKHALMIGDGDDAIVIIGSPDMLTRTALNIAARIVDGPSLINDQDDQDDDDEDEDEWCCDAAMHGGTVHGEHDTWCLRNQEGNGDG